MKRIQITVRQHFDNIAQKLDSNFGINKYWIDFSKKGTKSARFVASTMSRIGTLLRSKKVLKQNFKTSEHDLL